jgi:hypothetical protein
MPRVYRDADTGGDKTPDNRKYARLLDFRWCRARPRSRTFSTYVDDVGAIGEHLQRRGDRDFRVEKVAAVTEAVRRDIEHAHDAWPVEAQAGP